MAIKLTILILLMSCAVFYETNSRKVDTENRRKVTQISMEDETEPMMEKFEFKHHDNKELYEVLKMVHRKCPNVTRIYSLSETSVNGVPLYMIELSTAPGTHRPMVPEFRYIANMHGNEVLGRELLLKLADHICEKYLQNDTEIVRLLSITRIHLLPSMNPDGWQLSTNQGGSDYLIGRGNFFGVDLNRDFPDLDELAYQTEENHFNKHLIGMLNKSKQYQPETLAVIRLIMQVPFVLSANLHGGDLVANYPYDESRSGMREGEYAKSPDDDTFRYLALAYSLTHADMADESRKTCPGDKVNFPKQKGITNGAKWYSVKGGMQDFNYLASNNLEITLELGCDKYPKAELLENEWDRNSYSLIYFIWQAHIGVKGIIRERFSDRVVANAIIHVKNITDDQKSHIQHDVTSGINGDYYRLLTSGVYEFTVTAPGYYPLKRTVPVMNVHYQEASIQDFYLTPYKVSRSYSKIPVSLRKLLTTDWDYLRVFYFDLHDDLVAMGNENSEILSMEDVATEFTKRGESMKIYIVQSGMSVNKTILTGAYLKYLIDKSERIKLQMKRAFDDEVRPAQFGIKLVNEVGTAYLGSGDAAVAKPADEKINGTAIECNPVNNNRVRSLYDLCRMMLHAMKLKRVLLVDMGLSEQDAVQVAEKLLSIYGSEANADNTESRAESDVGKVAADVKNMFNFALSEEPESKMKTKQENLEMSWRSIIQRSVMDYIGVKNVSNLSSSEKLLESRAGSDIGKLVADDIVDIDADECDYADGSKRISGSTLALSADSLERPPKNQELNDSAECSSSKSFYPQSDEEYDMCSSSTVTDGSSEAANDTEKENSKAIKKALCAEIDRSSPSDWEEMECKFGIISKDNYYYSASPRVSHAATDQANTASNVNEIVSDAWGKKDAFQTNSSIRKQEDIARDVPTMFETQITANPTNPGVILIGTGGENSATSGNHPTLSTILDNVVELTATGNVQLASVPGISDQNLVHNQNVNVREENNEYNEIRFKIETLVMMGFNDLQQNFELLDLYNGDLEAVVDALLQ